MGSPGDQAVNGGDAIYELARLFLSFPHVSGNGKINPRKGVEGRYEQLAAHRLHVGSLWRPVDGY